MSIPASAALIVPAVPEKTFDQWTVESLTMSGNGITSPRRLVGVNRRCRVVDPTRIAYADAWEAAPDSDRRIGVLAGETLPAGTNPVLSSVNLTELRVGDLNALALTDSRIASAMDALVTAYVAVCTEQGLL